MSISNPSISNLSISNPSTSGPSIHMTVHMPINNSINNPIFYFQILQILVGFSKHPDRERVLEVWVCNSASLVEYTFNRFLWPWTILPNNTISGQRPGVLDKRKQHTGRCRDITSRTAFSMGSAWGYSAYIRPMTAQHVCTTWVSWCSTQALSSQDWYHMLGTKSSITTSGLLAYLPAFAPSTICSLFLD